MRLLNDRLPHKASRWATALVVLAMLSVSTTGLATHNSYGADIHVIEADEVVTGDSDDAGTIQPDVDRAPYKDRAFHHNLKEDGLSARPQPVDQSGERYRADQCDTAGEIDDNGGADPSPSGPGDAGYDPGSDPSDCYVGFIDHQLEYRMIPNLLITFQSSDLLYPVNPAQGDGYCRGEDNTGQRGAGTVEVSEINTTVNGSVPVLVGQESAADEAIARGLRSPESRCDGGGHRTAVPGEARIDRNVLEAPLETAGQALGTDTASGSFTLPISSAPYVYLFGQPHPETDVENRTNIKVGEGPFGSNPLTFGNPLADISGACGERTEVCELLSPEDIKNYDTDPPSGEDSQARVCKYHPRYAFSEAGSGDSDRGGLNCGVSGSLVGTFVGATQFGGLGVSDQPTWVSNLPGWYYGVIYPPTFQSVQFNDTTIFVPNADNPTRVNQSTAGFGGPLGDFVEDYRTQEKGARLGFLNYVAVNPKVPQPQDTLRCVIPGFLAEGDDSQLPSGFSDPGVYGTYQADAIDVDIYPHALRGPLTDVRDATHDPVYENVSAPAHTIAQDVRDAFGQTPVDLPPTVDDLSERTAPLDVEDPEPHAQPGPDNARPFMNEISPGFNCQPTGQLTFQTENTEIPGGLRFNASLSEAGDLKDPTALEDLFPKSSQETDNGAWLSKVYSFDGVIHAVLDSNGNGEFDTCPGASFDAGDDACPWKALWDAYNPNCTNVQSKSCGEILRERGYNTTKGVGLFFTLQLTGPIVTFAGSVDPGEGASTNALVTNTERDTIADRTRVIGLEDPTAQNCVIGLSTGFDSKLARQVGDATDGGKPDTTFDEDDRTALCPDQARGGSGEIVVVEDAFADQERETAGSYDAGFSWVKVLPTPATMQESTGFGAEDELCVTGIWSVNDDKDGEIVNATSATGDDNGIADDTEADPDSPGQENIVLENGVHEFEDCDSLDTLGEPDG